jgi:hypothetical protein
MLKKIGLGLFALAFTYISAMAITGNQIGFPIIGGASYCGSFGNNGVCNQTTPAGPAAITGNETIVANTNLPSGQNPQTVLVPLSLLADGATTVNATTGAQTPAVVDGVQNYIYSGAGTATFTTFTLPPNPYNNQKLCLSNAGTGAITLSSVVVGTTGQVFVGTTPTSLPVMTATGTVVGSVCWVYQTTGTTWYRSL